MKILLFILFLSPFYGYSQSRCVDYFLKDAKNSPYRLFVNSHAPIKLFRFEDFLFDEGGISYLNDLMKYPEQPSLILNELLLDFRLRIDQQFSVRRSELFNKKGRSLDPAAINAIQSLMELVNQVVSEVVSKQVVNYDMYVILLEQYMRVHAEVNFMQNSRALDLRFFMKEYLETGYVSFKLKLEKDLQKIRTGNFHIPTVILDNTHTSFPLAYNKDYYFVNSLGSNFFVQRVSEKPFDYFEGLVETAQNLAAYAVLDNLALESFFKSGTPELKQSLNRILVFIRKHRHQWTYEERTLLGAYYFQYTSRLLSSGEVVVSDLVEVLLLGEGAMSIKQLNFLDTAVDFIIEEKISSLMKYSKEELKEKILEIARKISQDFKSRLYNPQ